MSQQELNDVIQALASNKKRERLIALETLLVLLRQEDIVNFLNQKQNKNGISWNTLFIRVHNAVLTDVKKAESKSITVIDKQLEIIQNVISDISQKSVCEDVPLLDCDTVVCIILSIFESDVRMKSLGFIYTDLLLKYVLGHRKFWGEIKLEHWIEMKNLCKMCFQNPPSKTQSVIYLNALSDIIRLSCKNLMISRNFLDIFTFVSNIFTSSKGSLCGYGASLLRLVNILCLHLATEFRYRVCSFMEEIFDFVLSLYDKKRQNNRNPLIYHYLITYLNVHSPNGVSESDESFYAHDEEKWKKQIWSIYSLTQEITKELLRNPEKTEMEVGFMDLIVDINYLIWICGVHKFENYNIIPEDDEYSESPSCSNKRKGSVEFVQSWNSNTSSGRRTKRIKRSDDFSQILESLLSPDAWFWLIFLELLLQKYPQILMTQLKEIIEVLSKLLHDCLDSKISQDVCRCLSIILSKEKCYAKQTAEHEDIYLKGLWDKIGIEVIRLFRIDNSVEYHKLMRALVITSKVLDLTPVINLYYKEVFDTNIENFLTLFTICQNCMLPETFTGFEFNETECYDQVRLFFLKWLFRNGVRYPTKELSKVLITLISKKSEEENDTPLTNTTETLIISKNIGDFCKLITSTYETVSMKNLKFIEDVKLMETTVTPKIDVKMQSELLTCLKDRFDYLHNEFFDNDKPVSEKINTIRDSIHHCEVLLHLYSYLMNLGIEFNNEDILDRLKTLVLLSTNTSCLILKTEYFSLVEYFTLYSGTYHIDLSKIIRQNDCIYLEFLQHLFKIFQEGFMKNSIGCKGRKDEPKIDHNSGMKLDSAFSNLITNPRSILHINSLSEDEKKIVEIVEVICHFIIIPGSSEQNQFQKKLELKLFEELTREDVLNLGSDFHLQIALRVVYNFSKCDGINSDALKKTLKILLLIFESTKHDSEIAVVILQIMKDLIYSVSRAYNKDCESMLMLLINGFQKMILDKKKFGTNIITKFMEVLTEIMKSDWDEESLFHKKQDEIYEFCRVIILFLKHPYYEVRLYAAQQIGALFSVPQNNEVIIARQRKMINLLKSTLMEDKNVVGQNNTVLLVLPYHKNVGVTVSIISWATIVCLSNYWRRLALFCLIELAYIRKFNQNEVCRATNLIFRELNIKNGDKFIVTHLPYIMKKWVEAGYVLDDFPYYILGCHSLCEFLRNHSNILLPVLLWNGNVQAATKICSYMNLSTQQLLQECYPEIISIILPSLSENVEDQTVMRANELKRLLDKELGVDSSSLIAKYIDKIIFRIFCSIEDNNYLINDCGIQGCLIEESTSVRFTVAQIAEILGNPSQTEGRTFLGEIVLESPHVIQKVLTLLSYEVENACIYDDKVISFSKYVAFVEILSNTTRQIAFRNIITFIMRDVVWTLDSFIRRYKWRRLTSMALKCLKIILQNYIVEFSDMVCDFLSVITTLCEPLVLEGYKEAFTILKFLICDNFAKLQSAITTLDPFPNKTVFVDINNILEKNKRQWTNIKDSIRHFLSVASKKMCALEGLKCLHATLTTRKEELKILSDELNNLKGFSEDCRKSLLHQLICTLIEMTSDKNVSVRLEAAKCLGEIGPLDLTTLVLKPGNHYVKDKPNESPILRLLKSCLNDLSDLVINENLEIKKAASDLTYIILESQDGSDILEEEEAKIKSYLLPFCSKAKKNLTVKNNSIKLKNNMNEPGLWIPSNHEDWIKNLVKQLLKSFTDSNGLIEAMLKLVDIYWQFAERIFPVILDIILSFKDPARTEIIAENLCEFFKEYFESVKKKQQPLNLRSLQCMVNVVDYLRIQRSYEGIYEEFDLKINYLQVADAARYCSAFFTSALYVELWFNEKKKLDANLSIDKICELYPEEGFTLTNILRDCYSKIGILDGVQGCGYMHLLDFNTEIRHFEYLNKWDISMVYHDTELSRGSFQSEILLMNSLQQYGLYYSLSKLIQSSSNTEELKDFQYKCATALSDWNLVDKKLSNVDSFEKHRYFALKAFHDYDQSTFFSEIDKARRCTINKLSSSSLESVDNLYQFLSELRCLKELEDFGVAVESVSNVDDIKATFRGWCFQDNIKYSNFKFIEDILTQRIVLLKEEMERNKNPAVKEILHLTISSVCYRLVKTARKEKRYGIAIRHLNNLSRLENLPDSFSAKIKIEKSFLEWETGDPEAGKFLLCNYLKKDEIKGKLKAIALKIYGDWMASTNSENSMFIIEQYYLKSIQVAERQKDRMNSYASLAKFADSNYEQVKEYMSSPLFEIKKNIINRQQDIASELRQEIDWNQDREKKIAYRLVERQSAIDENEIRSSEKEKNLFLNLAIKYYLLSLREGDRYDLLVFRLISLWFSNSDHDNVVSRLKEYLHEIPTHKFLCLLPQIVPRMAEIGLISTLVERILLDHPYHALPTLFALANSFEDAKYGGIKQISCSQRALVARAILEKFQKNQKIKDHIIEMGQFCDAMIELANTSPVEGKHAKAGIVMTIPSHLKIIRLKNLSYVPVPSITIPYQKSCNYSNVTGIKCVEEQYQLVGGINVPKKVRCIGLDGVSRSLLVKGRDDLRQDAVMQQVFTIMNSLLYRNSDASRKKLVIRTYKVVPLSHRSGVIEWCENTQPLSLYLIGRDAMSGAHRKFHPDDITALECRTRLRKVFGTTNVTNDLKLAVFLEICEKFRPVFRHFFFENFPEPGVWFERRLAYTHSVATSSMIGYILGIGDRHVQNILIDNATAEVIHIDLGIAFEQGKTLPTPETVPFRLTRDIIDGMGISGVEGVFRLSCIKTMKVLRENQHAILTLLEVLLYDPLYAWTITAEKAFIVQGHEGTESSSERNSSVIEINKMAERALIRLKQKLQGTETGGVATTVEGQVNYLIQQARDPNNLSRLFHGWQAYL